MNHPPGRYLENVLEQPAVLRSLIARYRAQNWEDPLISFWKPLQHLPILLTGMGGSDSALWPLWFYLNQQGLPAKKIETSELIHYLPNLLERPGLCIVVSQSGESIEIKHLVDRVQENRTKGLKTPTLISISTTTDNSLSRNSDLALHTEAGSEVGVATKTFTSTVGLLHLLGRCLTETLTSATYDDVEAVAEHQATILEDWEELMTPAFDRFADINTYALVGRGPSQAAVNDGALVLKESLRTMAHGFSGGEFRHGPMEMLNASLGVLIFNTPGSTLELSHRLSNDVAQRGGTLITIGQRGTASSAHHLDLPLISEELMTMLEILPVQLLAHHQAQRLGLVPGNFQWSGKVVLQE